MKQPSGQRFLKLALFVLLAVLSAALCSSHAALIDLASTPLGTSTSGTAVKPNIMFIMDASGSMTQDYVPDSVNPINDVGLPATGAFNCRNDSEGKNACARGDPPYYADKFNGLSYNPQFTYRAGVNFDGSSRGNQGPPWSAVPVDNYDPSFMVSNSPTINLNTQFPEVGYCAVNNCASPRRNGIHNGSRFAYATPPKPPIAGTVTFTRAGSTVTANRNPGIQVGDVIDIANAGSCSGTALTVTAANATSFSYVYGNDKTQPAGCPPGTVSFSVVGYPEPVGSTFKTTDVVKAPTGNVVTVRFPNHNLIPGDVIDVTGGTNCLTAAAGALVGPVTSETFTFAASNANGPCAGTYTITRRPAKIRKSLKGTPFYFTLSPTEYCADLHLTDCVAATSPPDPATTGGKAYTFPAFVRYCNSAGAASKAPNAQPQPAVPPTCVDKFFPSQDATKNFIYPRYGLFTRGDIVPSAGIFQNRPGRTDCKNAPNCNFVEEMTNFANWYSYYRRRIQAMKTAAGLAFLGVDERYRVGFVLIRPSSPVVSATLGNCADGTGEFVPVNTFDATQKRLFYCAFYAQKPSGGTPLRSALARVGRYYAHKVTGINAGMTDDPVQYSCQQNFAILTTDGYWKGAGDAPAIDGVSQVGNQDGNLADPSGLVSRAAGTYDGGCPAGDAETTGGCANTLSDLAMYYYKTDLRDAALGNVTGALGADVATNNVPTSDQDPANWQHMVTFTIGLADGLMTWQPNYQNAEGGDFKSITSGASGCFWSAGGVCNWPVPASNTPTALDDLWHAGVDGHGLYFHASDPQTLVAGLSGSLVGVTSRTGAASSAATSTPNITFQDNVIFSTSYSTGDWSGQLIAQTINPADGTLQQQPIWKAQETLDAADPAQRSIFTFDASASTKLKRFDYALFSATEKQWVDNVCLPPARLSQCPGLTTAQQNAINNGKVIVDFIAGSKQNQGTLLRNRKHVLGDMVDATPAYVRIPNFKFADAVVPSYADFKTAKASRQGMLYAGANDGMLHAFNASLGTEVWAYVPRMLISKLYTLADTNYVNNHRFFVDGAPIVMDAFYGGSWHTVLVGGLNAGGRGFYALDVTEPLSPEALWEFCSDAALCDNFDLDLGFSFGNPIITKRGGTWVVLLTSGYNNVNPGNGQGFLYVLDLASGKVLEKISTAAGSEALPSGLAKIAAFADNFQLDNTAKFVYAGDIRGNVWRFDLTTSPASLLQLGTLTDANSRPQPVTTRPELGLVKGTRVVFVGTGRYLGLSDLQDPASLQPPQPDAFQQSLYAFKDTGGVIGNLRTSGNLVQQTITARDALTRTSSNNPVDWASMNGWYVDFNPGNASPGERVNIDPQLTLGTLSVKTNVPNNDACSVGGDSWVYQFRYDTGTYVATAPGQVVAQKISGAITVGFTIIGLPGGGLKDVATDSFGRKPVFNVNLGNNAAAGRRIGWREITR